MLILSNPKAGRRGGLDLVGPLVELLRTRGFGAEVVDDLNQVGPRADARLSDGSLRAFVAAGGDGTISELVNRTPPDTPITVLPLGTANLLAKFLGIRRNIQFVADMLQFGRTVRLDAGAANGRVFFLMASAGFDAAVVRRMSETRSGALNYWSYAKPIWQEVRSYEYPELRVYCGSELGGETTALRARWSWIVNIPAYAGGLRFAPQALADDGILDVCTLARGGLMRALGYLPFVWAAKTEWLSDCQMARATRVRIEADGQVPYQLDGDPGGMLPLDIEVLPKRLTLVVPATYGR